MSEKTTEIKKHLSKLFEKSLRISSPLYQLEMIRQKLEARSLQSFDKEDILSELGSIQHTMRELNSEMLRIHDLLKQS
jgi:hypothetical protein